MSKGAFRLACARFWARRPDGLLITAFFPRALPSLLPFVPLGQFVCAIRFGPTLYD